MSYEELCKINFESRCFYCWTRFYDNSHEGGALIRTRDHIIPASKGGRNCKTNKVWACRGCNNRKGGLDLEAFIQHCAMMLKNRRRQEAIKYYSRIISNAKILIIYRDFNYHSLIKPPTRHHEFT